MALCGNACVEPLSAHLACGAKKEFTSEDLDVVGPVAISQQHSGFSQKLVTGEGRHLS